MVYHILHSYIISWGLFFWEEEGVCAWSARVKSRKILIYIPFRIIYILINYFIEFKLVDLNLILNFISHLYTHPKKQCLWWYIYTAIFFNDACRSFYYYNNWSRISYNLLIHFLYPLILITEFIFYYFSINAIDLSIQIFMKLTNFYFLYNYLSYPSCLSSYSLDFFKSIVFYFRCSFCYFWSFLNF